VDPGDIGANIARVVNGLDSKTLFLGIGFALLVYLVPTVLAAVVGNRPGRVVLIGVLNLLFGWTGLVWFALLAWAIFGRPKSHDEIEDQGADLAPFPHTPSTG